jgi:hypothetical protein
MEILKHEDTTSISATFSVTSASVHTLEYEDLITGEIFSASATPAFGAVTFTLDDKYLTYTGNLSATVKNANDDIVILTNIDVVRPYCNTDAIAVALNITDGSEIEYERIVRYIIDSQTQSFNFVRKEKEVVGNDSDYLPIDEKIFKLYKVYANGELYFDSTASFDSNLQNYKITKDQSSLTSDPGTTYENKVNYRKVWRDRYLDSAFADGVEYLIDADFGWKVIPSDIREASELLIQDMKNDNLKYINRYIEQFDNEDFKIKFSKNVGTNTGNVIVDRILEKYRNRLRIGVL